MVDVAVLGLFAYHGFFLGLNLPTCWARSVCPPLPRRSGCWFRSVCRSSPSTPSATWSTSAGARSNPSPGPTCCSTGSSAPGGWSALCGSTSWYRSSTNGPTPAACRPPTPSCSSAWACSRRWSSPATSAPRWSTRPSPTRAWPAAGHWSPCLYAFAVQIYAGFSRLTDIAVGCALLLGIEYPRPFDAACTPRFLGARVLGPGGTRRCPTGCATHVYVPLGGNRHGTPATYRNIILTDGQRRPVVRRWVALPRMGAVHGAYLVGERAVAARHLPGGSGQPARRGGPGDADRGNGCHGCSCSTWSWSPGSLLLPFAGHSVRGARAASPNARPRPGGPRPHPRGPSSSWPPSPPSSCPPTSPSGCAPASPTLGAGGPGGGAGVGADARVRHGPRRRPPLRLPPGSDGPDDRLPPMTSPTGTGPPRAPKHPWVARANDPTAAEDLAVLGYRRRWDGRAGPGAPGPEVDPGASGAAAGLLDRPHPGARRRAGRRRPRRATTSNSPTTVPLMMFLPMTYPSSSATTTSSPAASLPGRGW